MEGRPPDPLVDREIRAEVVGAPRRSFRGWYSLWPAKVKHLFSKIPDWAILLFFFGLILLQAIPSLQQESATFDEVMRQLPGYLHLTAAEYRIHTDHPPLIKMLAALPLLFMDVKFPPLPERWTAGTRWLFAQDFLYRANDADRLVFLGRLAVLPLTLLLGFFIFRWSKELFGRGAATFALFLYSFEPNILAHGRLMNTDLGITCFSFLTMYFFSRVVQQVTLRHLTLAGLSFGLALVTKYSALWILPTLFLLGIGVVFSRHPMTVHLPGFPYETVTGRDRRLLVFLGSLLIIGLIAYVMIWGIYRFRYEGGTAAGYQYPSAWEQVLPNPPAVKSVVLWTKEMKLLPEAYLHGFSMVMRRMRRSAFLMGEISYGWWYYFFATFLFKTPLPLLIFLAFMPLPLRKLWREHPIPLLFLLGPVVIYFAIASVSRSNIGHRYLLPIYPFLFVLAGTLLPWAGKQRALVKGSFAALTLWYLVSSVSIFPHYLAYFNELAGGPDNGYKSLVDSNLDWGQDLKGLKRYMDKHGIKRVWLSFFGAASPDYYNIAYNYLPSYIILNPRREPIPTPYVAISATNLQGVYLPDMGLDRDFFADFRQKQPVAKIGYSIFVYQLKQ